MCYFFYVQWTVVGHEQQRAHLEHLLDSGTLAHAYLFAGPAGVGKLSMARDLASTLVPAGFEPDRMMLAPATDEETGKRKDISIEQVHEMVRWLSLRPMGTHKTVIIDDAEYLGGEAANALLKALEEPPGYLHFFLISSVPGSVLGTIASRCERMDFLLLSADEMSTVLSAHQVGAQDAKLLARVAAGRPGAALGLLEQRRLPEVSTSVAQFTKVLGGSIADKLLWAKKVSDEPTVSQQSEWWLSHIHAQLPECPQLAPVATGLLDLVYVLGQSQYNRRLALEHFLLSI